MASYIIHADPIVHHIWIKTPNNQIIRLTDAENRIIIETPGNIDISAGGNISVSSGSITISTGSITINTGMMNLVSTGMNVSSPSIDLG